MSNVDDDLDNLTKFLEDCVEEEETLDSLLNELKDESTRLTNWTPWIGEKKNNRSQTQRKNLC